MTPQQGPAALRQLNEYRNLHHGETFLVCGCGPSLAQLTAPHRFLTIGVNDVGRLIQPDYLVVLNPKHQFTGDRFRFVEETRATAVFSHLSFNLQHAPVVPVRLGRRGGVDDADPGALHYTRNSPYMAICLAMHMGAARIGLLGVDFTEHHFFGETGRHPLAGELRQIDAEYQRLFAECERRGCELFNLSPESKLTSIPKLSQQQFTIRSLAQPVAPIVEGRRVFFVHYRFQTCGEVFRDGLEAAARELGLDFAAAHSFRPDLEAKIIAFNPELLFVVHGRKLHQRARHLLERYNSAVWLLDEPYEVDDTSRFSSHFRTVFANDPETLPRHTNAHYLPVCYNPYDSAYSPGPRRYRTGFIGDADPARERLLAPLAERGLISYVAGGPWHSAALRALSLGQRIPADQTTALYRETEIVLNIFRSKHHFNNRRSAGTSLNPRVYESAANGALPLSEFRPELLALWPQAPTFHDEASLTLTLQALLDDPQRTTALTASAVRAFRSHTYANRLSSALALALEPKPIFSLRCSMPIAQPSAPTPIPEQPPLPLLQLPGWLATPEVAHQEGDDIIVLARANNDAPGSERGLFGTEPLEDLTLSFEVWLDPGTSFLAKIHQGEQTDQTTNSYHLHVTRTATIVARHNHVLGRAAFPFNSWVQIGMGACGNRLSVHINDQIVAIADDLLPRGFCFIGIKGGRARLRNLSLIPGPPADKALPVQPPPATILLRSTPCEEQPLLSIVTTVYDRVECLDDCLTSLENLTYRNYEHIIVADAPEPSSLQELAEVIERHPATNNRIFANLTERHNDWGIAPAAAGLAMSTGKYAAFLSDDNGYLPDHFEPLIAALERDVNLGFAYSSCLYAGRHILRRPRPCPGGIDLGQPVFRRETLDRHLNGTLPFAEFGWDWRMIERLLRAHVRYTHIDRASFIFRLHQYPHLKQVHA